jgi:hypothetical protein
MAPRAAYSSVVEMEQDGGTRGRRVASENASPASSRAESPFISVMDYQLAPNDE